MKRPAWISFAVLAVWAAWLAAVQGWLAAALDTPWLPDLVLLLCLALAARIERRRAVLVALVLGLATAATGLSQPTAALAGYLGATLLVLLLRTGIDAEDPIIGALLSGLCFLLVSLWWGLADVRGLPEEARSAFPLFGPAWRGALVTAAAALPSWNALPRLPGLSPLWRRRS